jgi:hypothetical protein
MNNLSEYFLKYFEVLYLDPRYHITNSSTSGVASNNASLTITGPILSWGLTNGSGQFILGVAPTALATSDNWFRVSLIKQYLNGQDEIEYSAATIETICDTLRSLRRSNANRYWPRWREQEGLS